MANPWYSTGTITVTNNSKEVSAVGALWVVNNVGAGDILFAPDGLAYEVETLSNDNLMTLKTVYKGASASSQPYGLVRFMSQSPISLANLIVDKTVRWEDVIDQLATYISGDATTSSVAPEDLCINYSLGTVKTGIAQVDCPVGFTFVASGANVDAGWFLFQDTVGNYRVSKHPETFRAEITALKDAAAASESNAAASALLASSSLNKVGEVNFRIAQAIRKEIYDLSGFIVFDEGSSSTAGDYRIGFVNTGLIARNGAAYDIWMSNKIGIRNGSVNINGYEIYGCFGSTSDYYSTNEANVFLPEAPVATNVDSTNSGLLRNGDFSLGDNGDWILGSASISATYTGTSVQLSQTLADQFIYESFSTVAGKTYILEFNAVMTSVDDGWSGVLIGDAINSPSLIDTRINTGGSGKYKERIEFTATSTTTYITYHLGTSTSTAELFKFAVIDKSEVERTDLLFLEVWEEDTSEKGFLYPYGNVQYGAGDLTGLTGIQNGDFVGFETYSLYGDWQAASAVIGSGYKLSLMTALQIANFVVNPKNNCYYTDDSKLIQLRNRLRTVKGFGDNWRSIDTESSIDGVYTNFHYSQTIKVQAQGSSTTAVGIANIPDSLAFWSASATGISSVETDAGAFSSSTSFPNAYQSKCYALPIARIKRLNKGAYHPVYNYRGVAKLLTVASGAQFWHSYDNSNGIVESTIDCFGRTETGIYGSIADSISGRYDSKLYDAVYADQIVDLRLSAYKKWSVKNTIQHLITGSARGLEGDYHLDELPVAPYLRYTDADYSGTVVSHTNGMNSGEMLHCDIIGDPAFYPKTTIDYTTTGATQSVSVVKGNKVFVEVLGSATGTVGNYYVAKVDQASIDLNLQDFTNTSNWIDTGSTNNNGWQESLSQGHSLFGTPLLIGEDGTDLIPDGSGKTYKLSKKAKSIVYVVVSDNAGASWSVMSSPEAIWSWNSATNSYTPFAPIGRIGLIFYTTYPELLEPTLNSPITDGEIGSVIATSNLESSAIVQSLINKVPVGSETTHFVALSHHQDINANLVDISYSSIDLAASDVAVSMCAYKTEDGIEVVAKELKHDGVDWGDNSKITQADNVTTDTDLNAATVLVTTSKPKLKSDLR